MIDTPQYVQKMVQAALMYYDGNMTQQEISTKLGTTRQAVSKLLNEAREKGIVEIKIKNPIDNINLLSEKMIKKFNIKKAIIVPSNFEDDTLNRTIISQKAVTHISTYLTRDNLSLGISWGRAVYSFIQLYNVSCNCKNLKIFPLVGASNEAAPYFMINEMVRLFAEKAGGSAHFVYIPINPDSNEEYKLFSRTKAYQSISQLWKNADLAIVGIGSLKAKSETLRHEYPGENDLISNVLSKGVVGDICTNYFDIHGNIVKPIDNQKLINISENDLKNIKTVIALAGGVEKTGSIIGALRTGIISDIITDEITAREVLEKA